MKTKTKIKKRKTYTLSLKPISGKNIVLITTTIFFFYIAFAILAPVLTKLGYTNAGNIIYKIYSYLCHQRAERSLFLFGKKIFYSVEEFVQVGILDIFDARNFIGDKNFGYKLAFCVRDLGIYLGLTFSGVYVFFKSIPPKPIKLKLMLLGVTPLLVDGIIQFIAEAASIITWNSLVLVGSAEPFYTSTNPLRLVTGLLFGVTIGLWLYPSIIEEIR